MDIKVLVAAHKPYRIPAEDVYIPVFVGSAGKPDIAGYVRDDTGLNISAKNPHYCELTGLYWAWKNTEYDALGLVHYRRLFVKTGKAPLTAAQIEKMLLRAPVWVPKKRHYWIETNQSQYEHAHHVEDLVVLRKVLEEFQPDAVSAWDASMKKRSGHRFNMFVMTAEYANAYCEWLFPILFEVQKRLDISNYSVYDARVFGFLGERLMDVWLQSKSVPYCEARYINLESQNWPKKIIAFLRRKFIGKK